MILKHRAALGGVQLDSVDDRIMISGVETGDGKESTGSTGLWGEAAGSRLTEKHRDYIDITVRFTIRLRKKEMQERETVIEKANAWAAGGGWLTTNNKPGRRIRVIRQQAAAAGDPWEWTKVYAIVFRAYGVPFWQETTGATGSKTNASSGTISLSVGGSETTVMDAEFKNTSGSEISTFSIDTGAASMNFTGLGLANGETLVIDHTDNGKRMLLRIRIKNTSDVFRSALAKRTSGSGNDLYIEPGSQTVTISAGGNGNTTVTARGRFA